MVLILAFFLWAQGTEPAAAEAAKLMRVPEGFQVSLFAGEPHVRQPIGFCIDDRGRLWVAENYSYPSWSAEGRDRVLIFEDVDGDGAFDRSTVFYDRLNYVTGIETGFGGTWILSVPSLLFIPDRDRDDKPDGPPEVVFDGFGREGVHNIGNGFTWGPDGWLYGGHGATSHSRVGPPGAPDAERVQFNGGVFRIHPTRHVFEEFAEGTVNPWGVAFNEVGQAFVSNCVLPHLFHVIQGGHYPRRQESPRNRHTYGRIETIADHLHWVGKEWNKSGGGKAEQIAAGGGHAHSGAMIYLGDSFPEGWRGMMFMVNIHGKRVNSDILDRKGSGYVARHGKDFLQTPEPSFMGLLLQYGPDGSVFVSDWSDQGECHTKKPNTSNGRIYKISYGRPVAPRVDIASLSDEKLVELQDHKNDWHASHARRVLQERQPKAVHDALWGRAQGKASVTRRLRALWALHAAGGLDEPKLLGLMSDPEEHVRAWAIQLELEDRRASDAVLARLRELDPSPVVRLYIASACQRLPLEQRWEILQRLAGRPEDVDDPNLPLMIWYAAEPLAAVDPRRALELVGKSPLPRLREFMSRRIAGLSK